MQDVYFKKDVTVYQDFLQIQCLGNKIARLRDWAKVCGGSSETHGVSSTFAGLEPCKIWVL